MLMKSTTDLIISKKAHEFLNSIWKNDGICYSSLKTEKPLKSAKLGKNMKRINDSCEKNDEEMEEEEELDGMLLLFRELYKEDESNPTFLYGIKSFDHRVILKAEPQCGKTGAFLHTIFLFFQKFGNFEGCGETDIHKELTVQWNNALLDFTTEFYKSETTESIKKAFSEDPEKHKRYMKCVDNAKKLRQKNGILEPALWAAQLLIEDLLKSKKKVSISFIFYEHLFHMAVLIAILSTALSVNDSVF